MQGVFTSGFGRFATKKALKEQVKQSAGGVHLEATSLFGNEYEGVLNQAPAGNYTVVGPDPRTSRKWYANIRVEDRAGMRVFSVE